MTAQTIGHDAVGVILSFLSFDDSLHAAQTCTLWYETMLLMPSRQVTLTLQHFGRVLHWSPWKAMDADARRWCDSAANMPSWMNLSKWWHQRHMGRHMGHHIGAIRFHDDVCLTDKTIRLDQFERLGQQAPQLRSLDLHMYVEDISEDVWSHVTCGWKLDWKLPEQLRTLRLFLYWDTSDVEEPQRVFAFMTQRLIAQCVSLEELHIVPLTDRKREVSMSFEFLNNLPKLHTLVLLAKECDTYELNHSNKKLMHKFGFRLTVNKDEVESNGDTYNRTLMSDMIDT